MSSLVSVLQLSGIHRTIANCVGSLALAALATMSAASPAPPGRLHVIVTSPEGRAILVERYLAVVQVGQPLSNPVVEVIVAFGAEEPTWELPAGSYRVLWSALGYAHVLRRPFDLAPGGSATEVCVLTPLETLKGRVLSDPGGKPVARALVGPVRAFEVDAPNGLSPLGQQHAWRNYVCRSDENGAFELHAVAGHRATLLVEAEGMAPGLFPDVTAGAGNEKPLELRVKPGGSLKVLLQLSGGAPWTHLFLQPGAELGASTKLASRWLLQRRIGTEKEVYWRSLPEGTYEVYADCLAPSCRGPAPTLLGMARVKVGVTTVVTLPAETAPTPAAAAPDFEIALERSPDAGTPGLEVRRWDGKGWIVTFPRWSKVNGKSVAIVPSGCIEGAVYVLTSDGSVSTPVELEGGACTSRLRREVRLLPAATVSGAVRVPKGGPAPRWGSVQVVPCEEGVGPARAWQPLRYPVALEDSAWSARVPAGCADVTLSIPPYAPLSWWGLKLSPSKDTPLGTADLLLGSSVLLRVVSSIDGRPLGGAKVWLVPAPQMPQAVSALLRGGSPPAVGVGRTGERGWLRLAGLPEGEFQAIVVAPGLAPAISGGFPLRLGQESTLDDIEVVAGAQLEVQLVGASNLSPNEIVAEAQPVMGCGGQVLEGVEATFGPDWRANFSNLWPGRWRVSVVWCEESGLRTELDWREVQLSGGEVASLEFDVGGRAYHGRVLLGNEGVEATLRFQPRSQRESPRHAQSDKLGFFSVLLKRPGDYNVAVRGKSEAVRAFVRGVKVSEPDEPITIRLPEGRIEGFVVDEQDKALAGAQVSALCAPRLEDTAAETEAALEAPLGIGVTTSPDGRFELNGLDACRWLLTAQAGEKRGGPVAVRLGRNERLSGLRLRLAKGLEVLGRVLDAFGRPIGGAGLQVVMPAEPGTSIPATEWLTTDSEGRFSFVTSRRTPCIANLEVAADGLPVSAFRVPTTENVEVRVPQSFGSARFELPAESISDADLRWLVLVREDGAFVSWVGMELGGAKYLPNPEKGGVLLVPRLAPGIWRLVRISSEAALNLLASGQGASLPALATAVVERAEPGS